MCSNFCRCCFSTNIILSPIKTKSSHNDDKTLLDYFNAVLGAYIDEHITSDFICMRCSKALQVTYHFINMVKESIGKKDLLKCSKAEIFDNLTVKKLFHKSKETQGQVNSLKRETTERDMLSNQGVALKSSNSFNIFVHDSKTDAGLPESKNNNKVDFKCIICNKIFEDKYSFLEHNRQQHKEIAPYKCKLCNFYTCYTESLFKHCKKNHDQKNMALLDLYQTEGVREPKTPEKSPEFEITYLCIPCNFKDCSQTIIEEHLLNTHSIEEDEKDEFIRKIINCPLCHNSFVNIKSAKIHYSIYHIRSFKRNNTCNNRKFACGKCGKSFDLKSSLFLHKRVCERREAVNCNFCSLQFTSVLKYERHLQAKHAVAIKYECEMCGKTFNCSEYLTVHCKRHNKGYYQCDLCPKNYIGYSELKLHKQRKHAVSGVDI